MQGIIYNDRVTIRGIPLAVYDYVVDLILKVVTVSMETQKIVSKLPRLDFGQ